jgi:hypothetical protein
MAGTGQCLAGRRLVERIGGLALRQACTPDELSIPGGILLMLGGRINLRQGVGRLPPSRCTLYGAGQPLPVDVTERGTHVATGQLTGPQQVQTPARGQWFDEPLWCGEVKDLSFIGHQQLDSRVLITEQRGIEPLQVAKQRLAEGVVLTGHDAQFECLAAAQRQAQLRGAQKSHCVGAVEAAVVDHHQLELVEPRVTTGNQRDPAYQRLERDPLPMGVVTLQFLQHLQVDVLDGLLMNLAQDRYLSRPEGNACRCVWTTGAGLLSVRAGLLKDTEEAGKPVQITGIFLRGRV